MVQKWALRRHYKRLVTRLTMSVCVCVHDVFEYTSMNTYEYERCTLIRICTVCEQCALITRRTSFPSHLLFILAWQPHRVEFGLELESGPEPETLLTSL